MQTIKLRSRVDANGTVQLQLPEQLANQDVDLVLVYQPAEAPEAESPSPDLEDPLIGLFTGSPNLASQSEAILEQDISPTSGLTWKQS